MSASNKVPDELLKADGLAAEMETERQLQHVREFIDAEQAKLRRMKWLWVAIAAVVQALLWIAIIWFPANHSRSDKWSSGSVAVQVVETLLPILIVSGCVALLLLQMWRSSRREAQLRLAGIEEKLAALARRD